MLKFCQNCGTQIADDNQAFCPNCGANLGVNVNTNTNTFAQQQSNVNNNQKSKMAAGLLGIFLGGWGIHNFYLGYTGKGIAQILVTILTCGIGALWGLIEGIMILAGSITTDANGVPLKD